ncbi:hypothetical protein CspeluHIS016_0208340 [Cutaneotrichosporon spelunceum]|uniref:Calcium activated cation channel n=1 Tax=Cutaneotrichosporon spelunceum TaxID=1672016 RepID=A0AAD3YB65_9TREE|nr:hypothetical protein CspeluHIS016_0208340 [Cutaneotrichosporon spelunceum]
MSQHDAEDQRSFVSSASILPEANTINQIVKRIKAMANRLLPIQVELDDITSPTSAIVTPEVVKAFYEAGGDFREAVPFCLLRARQLFIKEGNANQADYEENICRATACEMIARRITHMVSRHRLPSIMSTRFRYLEHDGDISPALSALECAIDQHCTIFLSSNEAQTVVQSLWKGEWVQHNNENDDIDYVEYHVEPENGGFWAHFKPSRLAVPRYQNMFRIVTWIFYLFVYSRAVQTPLDATDPYHTFDGWEITLYVMTLAFLIDEIRRIVKTVGISTSIFAIFNFWTIIALITYGLIAAAFSLRVAGVRLDEDSEERKNLHYRSFQVLACVAPLLWLRLITVFEGYKTVGVLQVVVFRMLRESVIFFILLALLAIGFIQAMYALDAADRDIDEKYGIWSLINNLLRSIMGDPDFDAANERFGPPFGTIIYYFWNFMVAIILLNILIALFGTAYSLTPVRAPDQYVYPPPCNLVEVILVSPFEPFVSRKTYVKINKVVMTVIFFIPLVMIAAYESGVVHSRRGLLHDYFADPIPEDDDDPKVINPETDDPNGIICKHSFEELVSNFPDTTTSTTAIILKKVDNINARLKDDGKDKE